MQDFTNKEIYFILLSLKNANNFILSGDANQIVYSNFFSWSNLKTMLFKEAKEQGYINEVLKKNYRNSKSITKISNTLLKIKQLRFGSIDKESNYLIESISKNEGNIHFYRANPKNIKEINQETRKSKKFAVIVFDEKEKEEAKKVFNTELTFTIREAKGLEYQNIILFNFITNHSEHFFNIVKDISKEDLKRDLKYNRQKDKENKDLESYKITINSLYVALTRGIESLYILESKNHKLLELLDINEEDKKKIEVKDSTKEEWLEEARKLKELGKVEQAEKIEKKFEDKPIEEKKEYIHELKDEALNPKRFNKKAKDKFFKLVKEENKMYFIERLAELKYAPAKKYLQSLKDMRKDFISVVAQNNITKVKEYIKNGLDINTKDNGNIPLLVASLVGYKEIIELLIKGGADINIQNEEGVTALMLASENGYKNIVKLLIENGADIHIENKSGHTALLFTAKKGYKENIELLIENGSDVNIQNNNKDTALMFASLKGYKEIAKLLIANGADLNIQNNNGMNSLIYASQEGHKEIVELLKEKGAK